MAKNPPVSCVVMIGENAGVVWRILSDNGPLSMTKLVKEADQPRDTVMQAVGWLAREGKVQIEESGRNRTISLLQ